MTIRSKLTDALDKCSACCLDDKTDRRVVIDTLEKEIIGRGMNFSLACEALRWFVVTGETNQTLLQERVRILLEALGEAS